jgi:hypothetical protein
MLEQGVTAHQFRNRLHLIARSTEDIERTAGSRNAFKALAAGWRQRKLRS